MNAYEQMRWRQRNGFSLADVAAKFMGTFKLKVTYHAVVEG